MVESNSKNNVFDWCRWVLWIWFLLNLFQLWTPQQCISFINLLKNISLCVKLGFFTRRFSFDLVSTRIELHTRPFSLCAYVLYICVSHDLSLYRCSMPPNSTLLHPDSYLWFLFEPIQVRFRIMSLSGLHCFWHI